MKLRPSALEEYSEQVKLKVCWRQPRNNAPQQKVVAKYTSEDDRLCIEDQTFRMGIRGSVMNPQLLVTGLVSGKLAPFAFLTTVDDSKQLVALTRVSLVVASSHGYADCVYEGKDKRAG